MYEAKVKIKHRAIVLSSKQIEYKPKQLKGVVSYDFGFIAFRLRDDGLLIFDKDELLLDKDISMDGRKVASGVNLEGFRHTSLKGKPILDEETLLNLINKTNLLLKQCTPSVIPEGELYKKVDNVYIELVDGTPKLRVVYEE